MRSVARVIVCGLTAALTQVASAEEPEAHAPGQTALEVVVSGFPNDRGTARIALYASRATYEDEAARPRASARLAIVDGQLTWRIDSLQPGEYAVRVYHDANENGRLDTGRRGVPLEHYGFSNDGFSNDPPRRRGPARWEEARFPAAAGTTRIEIVLVPPPRSGRS